MEIELLLGTFDRGRVATFVELAFITFNIAFDRILVEPSLAKLRLG